MVFGGKNFKLTMIFSLAEDLREVLNKNIENKKQTSETPEHPEKKIIHYRKRPHARFTPRLKEVTKLLQKSFPKLFTRKPEPKYALKIGIKQDLLSWTTDNNITEAELGKTLGF